MFSRAPWACIVLTASLAACSDDVATEPAPLATSPKLTEIMKMAGGLHVMWELPKRCDGVELERKQPGKDFSVAYELPGTVDNKHDGLATEDTTYTYRARCRVDAGYTAYSNEMSANPR